MYALNPILTIHNIYDKFTASTLFVFQSFLERLLIQLRILYIDVELLAFEISNCIS